MCSRVRVGTDRQSRRHSLRNSQFAFHPSTFPVRPLNFLIPNPQLLIRDEKVFGCSGVRMVRTKVLSSNAFPDSHFAIHRRKVFRCSGVQVFDFRARRCCLSTRFPIHTSPFTVGRCSGVRRAHEQVPPPDAFSDTIHNPPLTIPNPPFTFPNPLTVRTVSQFLPWRGPAWWAYRLGRRRACRSS